MIRLYLSKIIAFLLNKCMNPQLMFLKFNFIYLFFLKYFTEIFGFFHVYLIVEQFN